MPRYEIKVTGNAWVESVYYGEASSPEEAERKVRAGEYECKEEYIHDKEDTYVDVEEIEED